MTRARADVPSFWIRSCHVSELASPHPKTDWFNDAHEAEARRAQLRKPPSLFGTWILRRLGFRGEIGERAPHAQTRHPHEHPVHRDSEN